MKNRICLDVLISTDCSIEVEVNVTVGPRGELIMVSDDNTITDDVINDIIDGGSSKTYLNNKSSFSDVDFITIPKSDAENILSILNETITKLDPTPKLGDGDDVRVFGLKAISYERLYDRVHGEVYPSK